MVNILRSLLFSLIGLGPFAAISIIFIITMIASPGPESAIVSYIGDYIINSESLADSGDSFEDVSYYIYRFFRNLNIILLVLTVVSALSWSTWSHYLNVDAPGKAKIYFIHWAIFSGVFAALLFGVLFFFTQTTEYVAQQYLSNGGKTQIILISLVLYIFMYYVGVLLGTARFARSSVLFANKLPGGF
ncbi:hypothetical protein OAO38_04280 [Candidatus Pelagibacter ubique]|nr:hypothetical protein [Candidatus Pelagibacter ubique]